jgi:hypothetical protein
MLNSVLSDAMVDPFASTAPFTSSQVASNQFRRHIALPASLLAADGAPLVRRGGERARGRPLRHVRSNLRIRVILELEPRGPSRRHRQRSADRQMNSRMWIRDKLLFIGTAAIDTLALPKSVAHFW